MTVHALVKDVMTAEVIAVGPDASYADMAAMLRKHRVSGFPVVDGDGIVVGVISESDLLVIQAAPRRHKKRVSPAELIAADLMTRPVVTIGPDEQVRHAARVMYSRKVRRLPVVDHQGRLVGILTRADVLSVFTRPDEEIRREITQDVIAYGFFTDPERLTVIVNNGIVTLAGEPGSVILGLNIAEQVRHVEGVVAVRDRFTYSGAPPAEPEFQSPTAESP